MELRAEPRFETHSPAVLEVVRDKVYTYETTITEVSGIGLRIELADELAIGEDIRLMVNGHQMFARVRRCVPSESGFVIGVERIDDWNGLHVGNAPVPAKSTTTSPVKLLGRPALKNPLDKLHGAALRSLFADPRLRTSKKKYQTGIIAAGCIALAGWAGIGAGISFRRKPQGVALVTTGAARQLPNVPKSAADVAPPKAAGANLVASEASSRAVVAPPSQIVPPVQKAEVAASPNLAARSATVPASRISIKANGVSWLTACADGAKVLDMLLVKGYVGQLPFSRQATLRFGNAGVIELAVGNQPLAKLGQLGQVTTVRVSPSGYELITLPSALNCNIP